MALTPKELLHKYHIRPRKGLGQNFLLDDKILQRIVDAADITANDTVVEVGAGLGTMTRWLAERAARVIAIEKDAELIAPLEEILAPYANVEIIHDDALNFTPHAAHLTHYKLVANLPYYITSAILRHFLEAEPRPEIIVVTMQREVAERIVAAPGEMSILAVSVQFYGAPRILFRVKAGAFYPSPQVDSAVLRIDAYSQPALPDVNAARFFEIVRAGFGQKRKQLRNSLAHGLDLPNEVITAALESANIAPTRRAESLSVAEWGAICRKLEIGD